MRDCWILLIYTTKQSQCWHSLSSKDTASLECIATSSMESSLNPNQPNIMISKTQSLRNLLVKLLNPLPKNSTKLLPPPRKHSKPGLEFLSWVLTSFIGPARQRYMFDLAAAIRRDTDKLAAIMTEEHGKTSPDSKGDVQRGL